MYDLVHPLVLGRNLPSKTIFVNAKILIFTFTKILLSKDT